MKQEKSLGVQVWFLSASSPGTCDLAAVVKWKSGPSQARLADNVYVKLVFLSIALNNFHINENGNVAYLMFPGSTFSHRNTSIIQISCIVPAHSVHQRLCDF